MEETKCRGVKITTTPDMAQNKSCLHEEIEDAHDKRREMIVFR